MVKTRVLISHEEDILSMGSPYGIEANQLPDLNWFEFEVLSQLMGKQMYGNEILALLNQKFGEGSISSGKLYPVLQKLERKGFIERSRDQDVD